MWGGEKRRAGVGARTRALRHLTREHCLSEANAVSAASSFARPQAEQRKGVGAQRRPPHISPAGLPPAAVLAPAVQRGLQTVGGKLRTCSAGSALPSSAPRNSGSTRADGGKGSDLQRDYLLRCSCDVFQPKGLRAPFMCGTCASFRHRCSSWCPRVPRTTGGIFRCAILRYRCGSGIRAPRRCHRCRGQQADRRPPAGGSRHELKPLPRTHRQQWRTSSKHTTCA